LPVDLEPQDPAGHFCVLHQNSGEVRAVDKNVRRHRVAVLDRYGRDLAVLLQAWLEGRGDAAGRAPVPIAPP